MSLNYGTTTRASLEVFKIAIQQLTPGEFDAVHKTYLDSRIEQVKAEILGADVSPLFDTLKEIQLYLETNNLSGALLNSITSLTADLATERQRITAEIARATASEADLSGRITVEVSRATQAEGAEALAREAGDQANSDALTAERAERKTADEEEKKAREGEDTAIRAELGAETTERKSADTEEKKAREDGDALNAQAIANETSMRTQIDNLIFQSMAAKAPVNNPEFFGTVRLNAVNDEYSPHYLYISPHWRMSATQDRLLFEWNAEINIGATPQWRLAMPFISIGN